jgi:hypothetical protein
VLFPLTAKQTTTAPTATLKAAGAATLPRKSTMVSSAPSHGKGPLEPEAVAAGHKPTISPSVARDNAIDLLVLISISLVSLPEDRVGQNIG